MAIAAVMTVGAASIAHATPEVRITMQNLGTTTMNWTSGGGPNGTAIVALPSSVTASAAPTARYSVPLNTPANGVFTYTATGGHSCGYSYSRSGSCVLTSETAVLQSAGSVCAVVSHGVSGSGSSCINSITYSLK
ncbi:hypothetical protein GBZ48_25980 [Azospirillum melinis]|uniref:Uncharacterized protein n=1 Tax=Azospirillum melinis TaxID=328839 RepID=A0ABX2KPQ4_9PROT|nr:hypothetical protein [Azospirillum melinis]MBP2309529.1 hypothetical protein [Azospirillum melinis]NUB02695.1 hypothetical protein [Azospirillum melinis]